MQDFIMLLGLVLNWGAQLKRKSLKNIICMLSWQACIYHLGLERNTRIHPSVSRGSDTISEVILHDLKFKLLSFPPKAIKAIDPTVATPLGIRILAGQ